MSTPSRPGAADDPVQIDASFFTDPYALYAHLRAERPVARMQAPGAPPFWMITRYEDVRAALADPRLVKDRPKQIEAVLRFYGSDDPADAMVHDHMINSDPPRHTRLRKLVSKAFTARAVAALRPRIEAHAGELAKGLAAKLADGAPFADVMEDIAHELPMTTILEILAIPDDRRSEFRAWVGGILAPATPEQGLAASIGMREYLLALVAEKRDRPGDDILSAIVTVDEYGDGLSDEDAVGMASTLVVAGYETTVNLIGNGVLALLRNPGQWERLRAEPALLPGAVEEFLRLEAPVNLATARYTAEEMRIGDTVIPAGEMVHLALGSANRDPEVFERPDELNFERPKKSALAFGHGIHYCVGAPLGRLEGECAFRALLDHLPALELAIAPEELTWQLSPLLRALTSLPVRVPR